MVSTLVVAGEMSLRAICEAASERDDFRRSRYARRYRQPTQCVLVLIAPAMRVSV
jgi:hypothetical protein